MILALIENGVGIEIVECQCTEVAKKAVFGGDKLCEACLRTEVRLAGRRRSRKDAGSVVDIAFCHSGDRPEELQHAVQVAAVAQILQAHIPETSQQTSCLQHVAMHLRKTGTGLADNAQGRSAIA